MANYDVSIVYEAEFPGFTSLSSTNGGLSTGDRLELLASDTVTFINTAQSGTAQIDLMDSDKFTDTVVSASSGNGVGIVGVKASPTLGEDTLRVTLNGKIAQLYVEIVSSIDTTPNQFDIGDPVPAANLSQWYEFRPFTISGINTSVTITLNNCQYSKNGSGWLTSGAVANGDVIVIRSFSSVDFNTTTTCSINIGGVFNSNTILTKQNPSEGARITFPILDNVSFTNVTEFFGMPLDHPFFQASRTMSDYRMGGDYVPNLVENQNAGLVDQDQNKDLLLSKFVGSVTTVYFENYPGTKGKSENTLGVAKNISLAWNANDDWTFGYGIYTSFNMEYKFILVEENTSGYTTGVNLTTNGPSPSIYSTGNTSMSLSASGAANSEDLYAGKVLMYAKSLIDPNLELVAEINYYINFYSQ